MTTKNAYESEVLEEAAKLISLFRSKSTLSQSDFGETYDIGTQGMVSQYLTGRRPLNVSAAVGFARGLGVLISDFSPRISKLVREAADYTDHRVGNTLTPESNAILGMLEPLPRSEQKRMAEIIKTITTTAPLTNDEVEEKMPITRKKRGQT